MLPTVWNKYQATAAERIAALQRENKNRARWIRENEKAAERYTAAGLMIYADRVRTVSAVYRDEIAGNKKEIAAIRDELNAIRGTIENANI